VLEALLDAAAAVLTADSLEDTLRRIALQLGALVAYDDLALYELVDGGELSVRLSRPAGGPTR
jgi:hypothetical protein